MVKSVWNLKFDFKIVYMKVHAVKALISSTR